MSSIRDKLDALTKKVPDKPSTKLAINQPDSIPAVTVEPLDESDKLVIMDANKDKADTIVAKSGDLHNELTTSSIDRIHEIAQGKKAELTSAVQKAVTGEPANITLLKQKAAANKKKLELKEIENQARETELLNKLDKERQEQQVDKTVKLSLPTETIPEDLVRRGKSEIEFADLNAEQLKAVELARLGEPYCLVGSAGSGKTTTTKLMALELQQSGLIRPIGKDTKYLSGQSPSIIFVSFTNQAVTNIREAVPEEFKRNCLTIHKVLEYSPVFYEVVDEVTGDLRKTMRYEPMRTVYNPISGITHVVVEEAGSVDLRLFDELRSALPADVVWIFLGDLNQLPPVFGDAILGFKLLELPIVELIHSYRTDNTSPIKLLAYDILEGKPIRDKDMMSKQVDGKLDLIRFKDRVIPEVAVKQMGMHLAELVYKNEFDYIEDVVLTPYGKRFGSIELNNYIAQAVTEKLGTPTYEINAGIQKYYYAVGDIVYIYKQKGRIVNIEPNPDYTGSRTQPASVNLNRWGHNTDEAESLELAAAEEELDMEALFNSIATSDIESSNDSPFRTASHRITIQPLDEDMEPITISTTGDVADLYLAYCLTVHKSQGSEWNRVFCIFHHSQAVMMKREILYTSITRARQYLRIYFSGEDTREPGIRKLNDSTFQKGIVKQFIPGNSLEDKKNYFRGKMKAAAFKMAADKEKGKEELLGPRQEFDMTTLANDKSLAQKLLISLTYKAKNKESK